MTTTEPPIEPPAAQASTRRAWLREHSELGVCVMLLALGAVVLTDALTMDVALTQRGPVGPRTVRLVTHLDVDRAAIDHAAKVLGEILGR